MISVILAVLVALPVLIVASRIFQDSGGVWPHLVETLLAEYITNTVVLMLGVGVISVTIGVTTAWCVTMLRFPGSRVLEWALLLPLAVPAYVMAYVYTDLLEFAGPVQTGLRDVFGWGRRDYWFPDIRSLEGAMLVMGLVLYPYVYMLARAAFLEQSLCVLQVSRTLGKGPVSSFFRVALPLARPAIVAGLALALMETIADYGTVEYFGVPTFTTGIYRAWFGMQSPIAASQLAACLMIFVIVLASLERSSRGKARFHHATHRYQDLRPPVLKGLTAWLVFGVCSLPIVFGFLLPAGILLNYAVTVGDQLWGPRFFAFATNSLTLASVTAVLAIILSSVLAYALRLSANPMVRTAVRITSLGYAVPGSVIAIGVLIPFAAFDNAIDGVARSVFGFSTGLILTGTIVALVYAYLVRFMAVSFSAVESSLGRVSPSMDMASRTLGKTKGQTLMHVHAPIMRGGLLTAAVLVFVDVMKELPATLIVRPFNFDTLAVRVYRLASDERLAEASTAALSIVAVGILPVILISVAIARSRPGQSSRQPD